jgi:hypothetical protein
MDKADFLADTNAIIYALEGRLTESIKEAAIGLKQSYNIKLLMWNLRKSGN